MIACRSWALWSSIALAWWMDGLADYRAFLLRAAPSSSCALLPVQWSAFPEWPGRADIRQRENSPVLLSASQPLEFPTGLSAVGNGRGKGLRYRFGSKGPRNTPHACRGD